MKEIITLRGEKRFLTERELHFLEALNDGYLIQDQDPKNKGVFRWAKSPSNNIKSNSIIGKVAGCFQSRGYIHIMFKGKVIQGHQLSFLNKHGYIPNCIDHKDEVKDNNYWLNLRDLTDSENKQNVKNAYKNSKSGIKGVFWMKGRKRWLAYITINRKQKYLGFFIEKNDAIEARRQGELKYFTYAP